MMKQEVCSIMIDDVSFECSVESADFFWGEDQVLYQEEDSVLANVAWKNEGFSLVNVLDSEEILDLKNRTYQLMKKIVSEYVSIDAHFSLSNYHHYVTNNETHGKIIQKTRFLNREYFSPIFEKICEKISVVTNCALSLDNFKLDQEIIILRISRPKSLDINPPHRDGYLPIWQDVMNVWLPVDGCNEKSSLPVAPGSHLWNEKNIYRTETKGATIDGKFYHVPAIVKSNPDLMMMRPNPAEGQALVFTPFLLHGCAVNMNEDMTRFSFELRLAKKV